MLNVTETVAVTQNFCDSHNFASVYTDIKRDDDFRKALYFFTEKLLVARPDLMKTVTIPDWFYHKREKKLRKKMEKMDIIKSELQADEGIVKNEEWNQWKFWRVPTLDLSKLDETLEKEMDQMSLREEEEQAKVAQSDGPVPEQVAVH